MPVMPVSMVAESQRKLLRQFFAGFFHQDWRIEADTPEGVVSHYATQMVDRAALPELSDAILAFIADYPNDDELADALFRKLGCYYSPKASGNRQRSGSCILPRGSEQRSSTDESR